MSQVCICGHKLEYHKHIGDLLHAGDCEYCGIEVCGTFKFSYRDSDEVRTTEECEHCHKMSRLRLQVYPSKVVEYPPYEMWCLGCVRK